MKRHKFIIQIIKSSFIFSLILILGVGGFLLQSKPANAAGTQYYIDSDSGNDTNSGLSITSAWRTVARVQEAENRGLFKAGDIISFRAGRKNRYEGTFSITHSGTPDSPIRITSYGTGSKPLFNTPNPTDPDHKAFWIVGNHIIIENLQIVGNAIPGNDVNGVMTDTSVGVFLLYTTGSTVRNMDISGCGFAINIDSNGNTVANNYIHDNLMIEDTKDVPYNDYGAIGVLIMGNNNKIVGNKFENNKAHSFDWGMGGEAIQFFAGDNEEVTGNVIERNFMINNGAIVEMSSKPGGSFTNNTFAYNLMRENRHLAILNLLGDLDGTTVRNLNYYNNTIIDTTYDTRFPFIYLTNNNVASDIFTLKNNIFYLKNMVAVTEIQDFTHTNNIYHLDNSSLGYSKDATEIIGDPQFVDFGGGNYSLKGTSPAVDAGVSLGFTKDYDNSSVPKGAYPDMGAFEFNNPNQGSSLRLYRFWSPRLKGHFFTADGYEKNQVQFYNPDWTYEGISFYIEKYDQIAKKCVDPTTVPTYRFWSNQKQHHFYTQDENEKNYVINNYDDYVWKYEGIAFCAGKSATNGRKPVFRFWSDENQAHFYTISEYEKDYVINNYDDRVWKYEGIAYYAKE